MLLKLKCHLTIEYRANRSPYEFCVKDCSANLGKEMEIGVEYGAMYNARIIVQNLMVC